MTRRFLSPNLGLSATPPPWLRLLMATAAINSVGAVAGGRAHANETSSDRWWHQRPVVPTPRSINADKIRRGELDRWIELLAGTSAQGSEKAVPAGATAAQHMKALMDHPGRKTFFWAPDRSGPKDGKKIVWIIPQIDRPDDLPLTWSGEGERIAKEQERIAAILIHLARNHGLRCVGTADRLGSDLRRSSNLDKISTRAQYLASVYHEAVDDLPEGSQDIAQSLDRLITLLSPYVHRQMRMTDGPGLAMTWLRQAAAKPAAAQDAPGASTAAKGPTLRRFGLDSAPINQRKEELRSRIAKIDKRAGRELDAPSDRQQRALMQMWLGEYASFDRKLMRTINGEMSKLRKRATELSDAGSDLESDAITKVLAQVRVLIETVLNPDRVTFQYFFYDELRKLRRKSGSASSQRNSARARKPELAPLLDEYQWAAGPGQVQHATKLLLAAATKEESGCAAVVSSRHAKALAASLVRTSRIAAKTNAPNQHLSTILIRPFPLKP